MITASEPEYIYHLGDRIKDLALHRRRDYETGLSFLDYMPVVEQIRFKVNVLEQANFVVVFDGTRPMVKLPFFAGEPYVEPNSGLQWNFPMGHVTIYHKDFGYWTRWHQADATNFNTLTVSEQLRAFFNLSLVE